MRTIKGKIVTLEFEIGTSQTKSGILIPDKDDKFKDQAFGLVIATGGSKYVFDKEVDMDIKVGNIVTFTKHHPLVGEDRDRNNKYFSMPEERVHRIWDSIEEFKKESGIDTKLTIEDWGK